MSVGGEDPFDDSVFDNENKDDTQKTTSLDSRGDNASAGAFQQPQPWFAAFPPSSAPKSSARIEISLLSSSENSQSQDQPAPPPQATPAQPDPTPVLLDDSIPFQTPPSTVPDSQPALTPGWDVEAERNKSPGDGRIRLLQAQGSQAFLFSSQELQTPLPPAKKKRRVSVDLPPRSSVTSAAAAVQPTSSVSLPAPDKDIPSEPANAVEVKPASVLDVDTLLARLPMEIHPARPEPSSTAEFTTHITPTLHMLAERMKLTRVFKPAHQARPLRALERGYWFLRLPITNSPHDSSNSNTKRKRQEPESAPFLWPVSLFDQFWKYLSTFIAKEGRAGWGVWCICELDAGAGADADADTCISLSVKIYTWGEIAAHIYLLLYLASERKIKRVRDVQWRDGREEPVICMP